jgi:PAS domain S-box-containing protein
VNGHLEIDVTPPAQQPPAAEGGAPLPAPLPSAAALLEALDGAVAVVRPDWTITAVNDAWLRLTKSAAERWVGRTVWEVFPTLRGTREERDLLATMADGARRAYRTRYRDERISGVYDVTAARLSAGGEGALLLQVRDASQEARLKRDHDRVLESIGEALLAVDAQWRFTYWNGVAERITGVSQHEVLGRTLWELFAGADGTALARAARETMRTREPRAVHRWEYRGGEGGRAAGLYDARTYPSTGGGVLVLFTEVSEREARERELNERNEENESLRELARALSGVTDSTALLDVLARAAQAQARAHGTAVLEVEEGEVVVVATSGRSVRAVGARFPLAGSLAERVMRERAPVLEDFGAHLRRQLGDRAPTHVGPGLVVPLVAHDAFLGALAVTRAVDAPAFTARDAGRLQVIADYAALVLWKAHLLEEVQAASQAKSNFLATMSHELRTPLTALTGYGELLADEIIGPLSGPQHEIVERMRSVTHQLNAMIDEVLTFSSIEAGREVVRAAETSAADLLRAAVTVVEPLARQKGLRLDVPEPDPAITLHTDADKVRQILVNLAGNAVKFTERGVVRVTVENGGGPDAGAGARCVRFAVCDTGIGIAAADQARLFQPFVQVDGGLTRRHGGTGLGLYISQRLARLLGGRIDLESAAGAGATFTLTLPKNGE